MRRHQSSREGGGLLGGADLVPILDLLKNVGHALYIAHASKLGHLLRDEYLIVVERDRAAICVCLLRSEEHTSELQSLMRISYAVFCLKKKKHKNSHE